jgi:hypothetical protein
MTGVRARSIDITFGVIAAAWLGFVVWLSWDFSFWSDDLFLIDQAGTWRGMVEPYNDHLSLVILGIYRAAVEIGGFSYTPFVVLGPLCLVAVPVTYYVTTRDRSGPVVAAVLAMPLLWFGGVNLRASSLNHYLVLVAAFVAAAALDRGRRADWVLAGALGFAVCSAGGGAVVAGACLLHNALARPHLRRWVVVLVPVVTWGLWRVAFADGVREPLAKPTAGEGAELVRDFMVAPFYDGALDLLPLAVVLGAGFVAVGVVRLRGGLAQGASFLAWSAASIAWAIGLIQSRGLAADPGQFRYAYLSMGFALLAVVPRERASGRLAVQRPAFAALVLAVALARAVIVVDDMRTFAEGNGLRGREAEASMLVLALGPEVIPDDAPISFYGVLGRHGTAGELRALMDRYGSPEVRAIDEQLVDVAVGVEAAGRPTDCAEAAAPISVPGVADHAFGVRRGPPLHLWSEQPYRVEVRRYGDEWVRVADTTGGVLVTLPALNDDTPWELRAVGACVGERSTAAQAGGGR